MPCLERIIVSQKNKPADEMALMRKQAVQSTFDCSTGIDTMAMVLNTIASNLANSHLL